MALNMQNQYEVLTQQQIDDSCKSCDDTVVLMEGMFMWKISTFRLKNKQLVEVIIDIECTKWEELKPFSYKKPALGDALNPTEAWEDNLRENYYPVWLVMNWAYKWPNHFHRSDSAIICAVQNGSSWETRYFPKKNLKADTWVDAIRIIGENTI